MSKRGSLFRAKILRRGVQVLFLLAFLGLVLWARYPVNGEASHALELLLNA